ncbi:putative SP-containing protein [Vairimorpha necatrix]|uniref:SP-containing protein n=1 Tax=Vairimorpha necatrix TaxID=6039 RepID=A0AAX4JFM4_9MICR
MYFILLTIMGNIQLLIAINTSKEIKRDFDECKDIFREPYNPINNIIINNILCLEYSRLIFESILNNMKFPMKRQLAWPRALNGAEYEIQKKDFVYYLYYEFLSSENWDIKPTKPQGGKDLSIIISNSTMYKFQYEKLDLFKFRNIINRYIEVKVDSTYIFISQVFKKDKLQPFIDDLYEISDLNATNFSIVGETSNYNTIELSREHNQDNKQVKIKEKNISTEGGKKINEENNKNKIQKKTSSKNQDFKSDVHENNIAEIKIKELININDNVKNMQEYEYTNRKVNKSIYNQEKQITTLKKGDAVKKENMSIENQEYDNIRSQDNISKIYDKVSNVGRTFNYNPGTLFFVGLTSLFATHQLGSNPFLY